VNGTLTEPRTVYYEWPREADAAVAWVAREITTPRELYHCAHLLTERRRRRRYAAPVASLWVDRDGPQGAEEQIPPASLVVASSPGHTQEYWGLRQPLASAQAAVANRALAHQVGADPSGWDLTQLLRIPGTVNHKYAEQPVVRLVALRPTRYDPAMLTAPFADLPLFAPRTEPLPPVPAAGAELPPPAVPAERLTETARQILAGERFTPRADGTVDRSASLIQLGRVLAGLGFRGVQLRAALARYDDDLGWQKYTHRPDAQVQYDRIVALLEDTNHPR
jgi:hypothetical protein